MEDVEQQHGKIHSWGLLATRIQQALYQGSPLMDLQGLKSWRQALRSS